MPKLKAWLPQRSRMDGVDFCPRTSSPFSLIYFKSVHFHCLGPCVHEYVLIKNDENAMIVLHLHIVFISFSYCFQLSTPRRLTMLQTSRHLLFVYQANVNNLWLLLYHCQKFAFSVTTIHLHDNIVFKSFDFGDCFQK